MTVATPVAMPRPARRVSRVMPDVVRSGRAVAEFAREETLDQMLNGVWEQLSSHATAGCLVCGGAMRPRYGASPAPIGGRCADCATTLS